MTKSKADITVLNAVKSFLSDIGKIDRITVGFSGGADSTALLYTLYRLKKYFSYSLSAVHVNHMIRGDEADRDMNFCRSFCEKYGIEFHTEYVDIPRIASEKRLSVEECARNERYKILNSYCNSDSDYLAVAHNSDDNLETLLLNISRGVFCKGFSAIPDRLNHVIRPLLSVSRKEIEDYCAFNSLDYVVDSTNLEDCAVRNIFRHKIIPEMEKLYPGVSNRAFKATRIAQADNKYLDSLAQSLPLPGYEAPYPVIVRRALLELIDIIGSFPSENHIDKLCNLLSGKEKLIRINKKYYFICNNKLLSFDDNYNYSAELTRKDNLLCLNNGLFEVSRFGPDEFDKYIDFDLNLDINKLSVLYARNRKESERVFLKDKRKEVKKLISERSNNSVPGIIYPVITDKDGEVVFIPGVYINEKYKGNDNIKFRLYLTQE